MNVITVWRQWDKMARTSAKTFLAWRKLLPLYLSTTCLLRMFLGARFWASPSEELYAFPIILSSKWGSHSLECFLPLTNIGSEYEYFHLTVALPWSYQISQSVDHDEIHQAEKLCQAAALRPETRALHEGHAVVSHDAVSLQEPVHHFVQRRPSHFVNFLGKFLEKLTWERNKTKKRAYVRVPPPILA